MNAVERNQAGHLGMAPGTMPGAWCGRALAACPLAR